MACGLWPLGVLATGQFTPQCSCTLLRRRSDALVARNKTVLAEYTARSGNFPTVTRVLLGKIGSENAKMSYIYDA